MDELRLMPLHMTGQKFLFGLFDAIQGLVTVGTRDSASTSTSWWVAAGWFGTDDWVDLSCRSKRLASTSFITAEVVALAATTFAFCLE